MVTTGKEVIRVMTVHEVSQISGVSIRALHYYDKIGLLPATEVTDAGYRMYDDTALERLQQILLFKELQFTLKEIKAIQDSPEILEKFRKLYSASYADVKESVRLGQDMERDGFLKPQRVAETIRTLKMFKKLA